MKVLYFGTTNHSEPTAEALLHWGHDVVPVQALRDALELVRTEHFDAVLVPEELQLRETMIDFAADAHRSQPKLSVLPLNDWIFDLLATLESLGTHADGNALVN